MKQKNHHIGENVKSAREAFGVSRVELAKKAGLSQVRMIETGHREGIGSLKKIARALGITLGQLIDWPVRKRRVTGKGTNKAHSLGPSDGN